jgi:hypothetical protein
VNLYRYVENEPTNWVDELGLQRGGGPMRPGGSPRSGGGQTRPGSNRTGRPAPNQNAGPRPGQPSMNEALPGRDRYPYPDEKKGGIQPGEDLMEYFERSQRIAAMKEEQARLRAEARQRERMARAVQEEMRRMMVEYARLRARELQQSITNPDTRDHVTMGVGVVRNPDGTYSVLTNWNQRTQWLYSAGCKGERSSGGDGRFWAKGGACGDEHPEPRRGARSASDSCWLRAATLRGLQRSDPVGWCRSRHTASETGGRVPFLGLCSSRDILCRGRNE